MSKINAKTNDQAYNKSKTVRWDRINRIILDGVTKSVDKNDYYFAKFVTALGEYGAITTYSLTGII